MLRAGGAADTGNAMAPFVAVDFLGRVARSLTRLPVRTLFAVFGIAVFLAEPVLRGISVAPARPTGLAS